MKKYFMDSKCNWKEIDKAPKHFGAMFGCKIGQVYFENAAMAVEFADFYRKENAKHGIDTKYLGTFWG